MNKPRSLLLLLCLYSLFVAAQTPNSVWYFGNRCGLDFSSGNPVAVTNSMMQADEGCVTVSNSSGAVAFYSNGDTVWSANNTPMPNGTGLNGQLSCSQSSLAVRKPGSPGIFYLFTLAAQGNANGLCYSEIDLSLNSGLGDVTANKNIPVIAPCCEKLAAVRHANGIDVWVVVHTLNSNSFYAYLVTGAGISAPVISNAGSTINSSSNMIETIGCMKFSCNGRILAVANYGINSTELFDFNPTTGAISGAQILNNTYTPYGVEFSPSCDYLYVTAWSWFGAPVYQYDLTAPNIAASELQIGTVPSSLGAAAGMQLGPDHKIYIAVLFADSLSVIQNPDQPGTSCNFLANGIYLAGRISYYGLPNFITGGYCIPANPDGIEEESDDDLIKVYPNPASDNFTIDVNQLNDGVEINIFDMFGELVHSAHYGKSSPIEIDASTFSAGIYFITIESERNYSRKKIIIQ
jgi:hypothetical protein